MSVENSEFFIGDGADRRHFPGLASSTFEHPLDRKALRALKQTAGFDKLIKFLLKLGVEPIMDYQNRSSFVRCSRSQCAPLYAMFEEAAKTLDIHPVPPLYLANSPAVNAWTFGVDKPYVVVTSALVEGFKPEEIRCVMGHELGHILAGHCLYRTVGGMLLNIVRAGVAVAGPLFGLPAWLLSRGLLSAFFYWIRCSELTADRAGLIVAQDPMVVYSTEMKLAGGPGHRISEMMSVDRFLDQAREFELDPNMNNQLIGFLLQDQKTHPFPVARVRELEKWVESGEYDQILDGEYIHRPPTTVTQGIRSEETLEHEEKFFKLKSNLNFEQKCKVEATVQSALSRVFGVYLPPKIPQVPLEKAVDQFASIQPGECILGYYDGGMDTACQLVVTTHGVFSAAYPEKRIAWDQITTTQATRVGLLRAPSIDINSGEFKLVFHRTEVRDGLISLFEEVNEVIGE